MNYQKRIFFSFGLLFLNISIFGQTTFFVSPGGTGQGTSWLDSSQDLNAILFAAKSGDEVWVAKGTYLPTPYSNRKISFSIPDNVKVYGGFVGRETMLKQRDIDKNETILSGNINTESPKDNSYNVVFFKNASSGTVLDGFTIKEGIGNGTGTTGARNRCGGGIYIDGTVKSSNPVIANCTIKNNESRDGGAVYNNGISGNASPTFINCSFVSNLADFDGGAVFNDGRRGGQSNPTFIDCFITSNAANYGGGVCNYGAAGESNPVFDKCQFKDNKANFEGDALFSICPDGECRSIIKNTSIAENQPNKNKKETPILKKNTKTKMEVSKGEKVHSL